MAASLAEEGNRLSAAYSFLLHDVGSRISDSLRDIAESIFYNLCLDDAFTVATSVNIDEVRDGTSIRAHNKELKERVFDSDTVTERFVTARKSAQTTPSDGNKLELKQALYKLGAFR